MFTVVCKYFLPFTDVGCTGACVQIVWLEVLGRSTDVGCTGTSASIGWVEVLEVLQMLDAQVFVCLPISWVEVLEVLLLGELC